MGKRYRNKGGYAVGPLISLHSMEYLSTQCGRSTATTVLWKVIRKCRVGQNTSWSLLEEAPRNSFSTVVSALLCPVDPCPATLAFSWWRHLVAGLRVVYRGSGRSVEFGLEFVNSWGTKWGDGGYGTVWNQKAVPFESVIVRAVKAVKES